MRCLDVFADDENVCKAAQLQQMPEVSRLQGYDVSSDWFIAIFWWAMTVQIPLF